MSMRTCGVDTAKQTACAGAMTSSSGYPRGRAARPTIHEVDHTKVGGLHYGGERRLDPLDDLLRLARAADGMTRMDLRDPIAAFGPAAVVRLRTWLTDPRLGAFAVRTIERASTTPEAATLARSALSEALSSSAGPVRGDIIGALKRLGAPSTPTFRGRTELGQKPLHRGANRKANTQVVPLPGASLVSAQRTLEALVTNWRDRGAPAQKGILWSRSDWLLAFPEHEELLRRLPRLLDRACVREVCADATHDAAAAERAFLAVMVWGYGKVAYGRHRVREILAETQGADHLLVGVARTLANDGALAAYCRLGDGGDCRLKGLGPAFGTKYLYFCQPAGTEPVALIHDSNVAKWFFRYAALELPCDEWSESTYSRYLDQMCTWAGRLRCRPDDLELRIFEATVEGQWAQQ
jgi:hypothetical protein